MTRKRSALIALAALVVLALTGCVRFQADLSVTPEDTVNGSLIVAVIVGEEDDSRQTAQDASARIETELLGAVSGAPGVERTVYDQDGYLGSRFTFRDTPLSAFDGGGSEGSLSLTREGDEFVFAGQLDFTPDDDVTEVAPDDDTSNITVSITFPGAVTETNGEVSGTTVRWESTYEARMTMDARASAISTGPPAWVWAAVAGAFVLAALGAVIVVVLRRRAS
jgi:hypothetical protein